MQYKATLRYLHITPRKVRRLADPMRGKNALKARSALTVLPQRPARPLAKLLDAAAASARERDGLSMEALKIKSIRVDGAPKAKRFMPRAYGRSGLIEKRSSHVALVLESVGAQTPAPARAAPAAAQTPVPFESQEAPRTTAVSRGADASVPKRRGSFRTEQPSKQSRIRALGRRIFPSVISATPSGRRLFQRKSI